MRLPGKTAFRIDVAPAAGRGSSGRGEKGLPDPVSAGSDPAAVRPCAIPGSIQLFQQGYPGGRLPPAHRERLSGFLQSG
jgi:hypothetical protein